MKVSLTFHKRGEMPLPSEVVVESENPHLVDLIYQSLVESGYTVSVEHLED